MKENQNCLFVFAFNAREFLPHVLVEFNEYAKKNLRLLTIRQMILYCVLVRRERFTFPQFMKASLCTYVHVQWNQINIHIIITICFSRYFVTHCYFRKNHIFFLLCLFLM